MNNGKDHDKDNALRRRWQLLTQQLLKRPNKTHPLGVPSEFPVIQNVLKGFTNP